MFNVTRFLKRAQSSPSTSANQRRLDIGLDRRPKVKKRKLSLGHDQRPTVRKFAFTDIFRSADHQAEEAMMSPAPSPQFRKFFVQFAQPRWATTATRMDPSFPSASGARLTLLL